jgi:hypothetical protein
MEINQLKLSKKRSGYEKKDSGLLMSKKSNTVVNE